MLKQWLPSVLVVLLAVVPVGLVFAHYSELTSQLIVAGEELNADGSPGSLHAGHCQPDKAHVAGCGFHICLDCAITPSFGFTLIHSPDLFNDKATTALLSLLSPPAVKPPILSR
ncbi:MULTISPECIES: hypothetical protein [Methylomonas]|uniref:hypothetical protein n=1 Tax=Methylomonas TaxID=416 RepID=UPI0012320A43|nr:hypothetical protein [Methylomonas rhizoryzae]